MKWVFFCLRWVLIYWCCWEEIKDHSVTLQKNEYALIYQLLLTQTRRGSDLAEEGSGVWQREQNQRADSSWCHAPSDRRWRSGLHEWELISTVVSSRLAITVVSCSYFLPGCNHRTLIKLTTSEENLSGQVVQDLVSSPGPGSVPMVEGRGDDITWSHG